jgi:hypothetical protein
MTIGLTSAHESLMYHLLSYDGSLTITSTGPLTTDPVRVTYTWTWLPGDVPEIFEAHAATVETALVALAGMIGPDPNGLPSWEPTPQG